MAVHAPADLTAGVKVVRRHVADGMAVDGFPNRVAVQANERLAHVCGTCRFGHDPRDSVLDRNNKAHGLDNLYVLDTSFFPSSSGTNPALTVAANALRVADRLNSIAEA